MLHFSILFLTLPDQRHELKPASEMPVERINLQCTQKVKASSKLEPEAWFNPRGLSVGSGNERIGPQSCKVVPAGRQLCPSRPRLLLGGCVRARTSPTAAGLGSHSLKSVCKLS